MRKELKNLFLDYCYTISLNELASNDRLLDLVAKAEFSLTVDESCRLEKIRRRVMEVINNISDHEKAFNHKLCQFEDKIIALLFPVATNEAQYAA